ncbi:MAG: hypothetical protein OEZ02_13605 [Anaerolineae bacterium]|nr:hypothetical protein [Anaerolineae bacterium]
MTHNSTFRTKVTIAIVLMILAFLAVFLAASTALYLTSHNLAVGGQGFSTLFTAEQPQVSPVFVLVCEDSGSGGGGC